MGLGAAGLIGGLVIVGTLTGGSGRGGQAATVQIPPRKAATTAHAATPPTAAVGPAEVAARFAAGFESDAWNQSPAALAARLRPWASPSLEAALSAPDGGGPPAAYVATRSVTTAHVLSTSVDPDGAGSALALVSLRLVTVSAGGASRSAQVALPLRLSLAGGRWGVAAVVGLVQ